MLDRRTSRRRFLAGVGGSAAALGLQPVLGATMPSTAVDAQPAQPLAAITPGALPSHHLAWLWQFNQDGELASATCWPRAASASP